jgi:ELWxxDGT repeat protein
MKLLYTLFFLFLGAECLAQTRLVKDITQGDNIPSFGSDPRAFCEFKGEVYFAAGSWLTGEELYKTDGTAEGTKLVLDLFPGESAGFSRLAMSREHSLA